MFRVTVISRTLPAEIGAAAPDAIVAEFRQRFWHRNPSCSWDGSALRLTVENDFDADGLATLDEFSDVLQIALDLDEGFDFDVERVEEL